MAETAGLLIGVIALAGTFKDCIDLFGYITASRNLGSDYDLITTKLDVEKTLFLQWAQRVHLLDEHYDVRLTHFDVANTISGMLLSVQQLLSDSHTLQHRHGMRPDPQPPNGSSASNISDHALSGPRMNRFISDFTALSVRSNMPRKDVPVLHKVRWAIHDKDKFENLIQQLSYFISKLDQIIPDTIGSLQSTTTEDLERLRLGQLQVVLEASCGREALIADIAKNAINKNNTSRILNCLWYRLIDDRRLTIHLAHKNTLNWTLQPHEKDTG